MFLVDFAKKGNVVKLFFGDEKDYFGDDWNDTPYEHNAGGVYSEFVKQAIDVAFPYRYDVSEPSDDWHYNGNSPYCKDDFKNGKVPCFIIKKSSGYFDEYSTELESDDNFKVYFNTEFSELIEKIKQFGGTVLEIELMDKE